MKSGIRLTVVLLCLFICSCGLGGVDFKNEITEEKGDNFRIYIETPSLTNPKNDLFISETNTYFAVRTTDWTEDFKSRIPQKTVQDAELSAVSSVKHQQNDFFSIITDKNAYTGGAHGTLWRFAENIDLRYSKRLPLSEIFIDNHYIDFLNRRLSEMVTENPDDYSDLWQQPSVTERQQTDYYIYDGNLIIFYQPYDLSYYTKGIIEFPIPISALRGYIKPEYADRLT